MSPLLAAAIFLITFVLIASDRLDRVLSALLGASLVLLLGVMPQDEAFGFVDFNVIFLLVGTMTIASVLGKTGVFQWIAVEAVRRTSGHPYRFLVATSLLTGIVSAFLNNATTIVLLAPVTFYAAEQLRISPVPFLVSQVIASNIGGTATLIGDPPNLLIGSAYGLGFAPFLVHTLPICVIVLGLYLVQARWLFRRDLAKAERVLVPAEIERLVRDERRITDPRLLRISLVISGLTLVAFVVAGAFGLREATIAMAGAAVLIVVTGENLREHLERVEWPTLLFFIGLFIVVGGIVKAGLIAQIAQFALQAMGGRVDVGVMLLLWLSGLVSAIVDNIPYTVAMIPLIGELGRSVDPTPFIWSLSLGANFGGNATLIGGAANIVAASLSGAKGHPITFRRWLGYGVPATVLSLLVSAAYVWVRYLTFR